MYDATYSMLKSWLTRPFQSATEATSRHPEIAYTDRMTDRESSGLCCHWPVKAMATHHRPSSSAAHRANSPKTVMGSQASGTAS